MFTTRPTLQGTFGMAATTHWLASQSAMGVLEDGGNAFDAAVAAGFVLHVVEPHLNGPAGEVPVIIAPVDGAVRVLSGPGAGAGRGERGALHLAGARAGARHRAARRRRPRRVRRMDAAAP
ncbi:hypothetical protein SRIMM317S_00544 [Streptomyces rimosus subsp. rimosus]